MIMYIIAQSCAVWHGNWSEKAEKGNTERRAHIEKKTKYEAWKCDKSEKKSNGNEKIANTYIWASKWTRLKMKGMKRITKESKH